MTNTDRDPVLYPNADEASSPDGPSSPASSGGPSRGASTDDPSRGASADGPSRRRLLAGSAVVGAASVAGCVDRMGGAGETDGDARPTVFAFNTGEGTVSVIDAGSVELVETRPIGATASFPSNQYAPRLTDDPGDALWLNAGRGVRAFGVGDLSEVARVETGSGANWLERSPDGARVVVSAREPAHRQVRIDADPSSETFGEVTGTIERESEGGHGDRDGPGPCDVTFEPGGEYAFVPDLFGDALTVLDVAAFEVETRVPVEPVGDDRARPWMATAAWDGETLLVEHDEGESGTESVWDASDPTAPVERVRLTAADGLGRRPLTSEVGPDSETGYVFTPGSEDVTVVDLDAGEVADRIDLGGAAFAGTWGPDRERLYVPVQTNDEVAVIDHGRGEVIERIRVGAQPYGATAARVRPGERPDAAVATALARLGLRIRDPETTYCIGNCACGHRL